MFFATLSFILLEMTFVAQKEAIQCESIEKLAKIARPATRRGRFVCMCNFECTRKQCRYDILCCSWSLYLTELTATFVWPERIEHTIHSHISQNPDDRENIQESEGELTTEPNLVPYCFRLLSIGLRHQQKMYCNSLTIQSGGVKESNFRTEKYMLQFKCHVQKSSLVSRHIKLDIRV